MINPRLSYTGIPRSGLTHKFDRRDLTVQKKKSPTDDSENNNRDTSLQWKVPKMAWEFCYFAVDSKRSSLVPKFDPKLKKIFFSACQCLIYL